MPRITVYAKVLDVFAPFLDSGDISNLSTEETEQIRNFSADIPWVGVGECCGFGICGVTGTRGDLVHMLAESDE